MQKLVLLFAFCFFVSGVKAQVSSDSTHFRRDRSAMRYHRGSDSLHNRYGADFRRGDRQSENRFRGNSQDPRFRSFQGHGYRTESFRLHYTAEQRQQTQAINQSYRKKTIDLYSNDNLTLREYKAQLLALQKEKKTKLEDLLTADQKEARERWKKQARENAQVREAARLERMKIHFQLSDAQTASIKTQRTGFRSQMQSIHENDALLPYQKMEQIKALAAKQKDMMKSVLTPDQYSEFENMHKQRLGGK
jgi:hypothetical protein